MHLLDLFIYIIGIPIIWIIISRLSNGEFTNELGTIVGIIILLVYTLVYTLIFAVFDNNWIDIIHYISNTSFKIKL